MGTKEYFKIPAVFKRDPANGNKMIDGEFISDQVFYLRYNDWIWTEKIDGTNTRIIWDGEHVTFMGHTEKSQLPPELLKFLQEKYGSEAFEELLEQNFGAKHVVLFGEGYGRKIQGPGSLYNPNGVGYALFDAFVDDKWWVDRFSLENIAKELAIPTVPVWAYGSSLLFAIDTIKGDADQHLHTAIKGGTAPIEGFVCTPSVALFDASGTPIKVKVKVKDLKDGIDIK